jgi:tetratricopeptide (TPR) repeat protein
MYAGRAEVEAALSALPADDTQAFPGAIRTVIDRTRNPERTFLRICEDPSRPTALRFAAFYAVLLRLRREERLTDYALMLRRYEPEFGGRPYFHTFRAVALRLEGSPAALLQAIEHCRQAARLLPDVAGVQHQLAEMLAESLEQAPERPAARTVDEAVELVDRAITVSLGRVAHYYETKARILCLRDDFAAARTLLSRAIELESRDGHDYLRRISQYQTTRVRIDVLEQRAEWFRTRDSFRREMSEFRTQQLEMLGLLAGVVAFVASTANIAGQTTGANGVRLITTMAGAVVVVFAAFFLMVGSRAWRQGLAAVAIGLLLLLTGLLAPAWLVHRT